MFKTNRTLGIFIFVFLALGMIGCGDRGSSSEQTSTTTDDLYFAEVSGTETPIVAIVADKSGAETLAILAEKDAEGNPVRITGAAYSSEEGYSGTIEVGTDGLPTTLTDSSGSTVTFTNYTESTVDISVYDSSGNLVAGPVTTNIDAGKIQEIKEMFGSIYFSATSKSEKVSRRGAIFQETSGGWWAEWGGTVWSWTGCTISGTSAILSGGVAIPIAALSCGSALFDTIAGFTENEIDDVVSLSIGSASCIVGADVIDCMSVLTDIMAGNYIVDTTSPTVSAVSPTNNATDVPINSSVTATFSEAIDASTLTTETFTLKQGTTAISGTATYAGTTATFTPSSDLNYSTTYTANISTGVQDSAGNAMANNYSWTFTTASASDTGSVPSAPSGVSATAGDEQVTITWDSVSGATSYNIYWSTTSGVSKSNGTKLSNVTSPYTHTGLTNGTTYYYVVTAVNSYGESAESSQVSATPQAVQAGTTWTSQVPGTGNGLMDVIWSGSKFVAVGYGGTILTSPDGITWTSQTSGTTEALYKVVWSGTQFVAVGSNNAILTSPEGVTWTKRNETYYAGYSAWQLKGVVWSGTKFVAIGDGGSGGIILTSSDGISWAVSRETNSLWCIAWSGSTFFATGYLEILLSYDGSNWSSNSSNTLFDVIWDGTRFVAVDQNCGMCEIKFYSADGYYIDSADSSGTLQAITYSGNLYVAVGSGGVIVTSSDGSTWTGRTSGTTNTLYGIAWSGTKFVAVGNGTILTSP